jgi:hypothetical protein
MRDAPISPKREEFAEGIVGLKPPSLPKKSKREEFD